MMQWDKLLNANRLGNRPPKEEEGRSPFHSDHDKVIFSGSFRRLARKTQVHPLATNDHVHNRLTHSLEVACVGRTLGMRVGQRLLEKHRIPEHFSATDIGDIVQTACLAHDIGNPPFGHTGEEAIRHWFSEDAGKDLIGDLADDEASDLRLFEGNAQGFRVLTTTEYHPYDGGLRLTYASLGAFVKYPWLSLDAVTGDRPKRNKYGVYRAETALFEEVAHATGLINQGRHWYSRHPLVHLMEMADDFCYAILDLEDGIEMGILQWEEVFQLLRPVLDESRIDELQRDLHGLRPGRKPPLIRGKVISAFVDAGTDAFIANEDAILRGEVTELLPLCEERVRNCVQAAKQLAQQRVYQHPRKVELEIGAYNTIATVLKVVCGVAVEHAEGRGKDNYRSKRVIDLIGEYSFHPELRSTGEKSPKYHALMRALDYVSGMTDNYVTHLARQFSGSGDAR
ncbi:deoxyguanosinetriphosphate triphosphohydrolase [Luteibacter anthropi]|uniref:deoxyguanosinetriphosphate triphosphohydrolase n=1 Tax=Luteibacter anthropi TaxID=564369 RepID=UPI002032B20B|nr:deoxyguanosinetriphosphate triphosphohydrolase [Luteibacter anthropi]URX62526.1 deoxyguanosinetriphosphate triphosphohydrolase [Luteibacter anthropi]